MAAVDSVCVSVIVPTYNSAKTIVRALKSAEIQMRSGLEIIVVDGGSTDGTLEIVAREFPEARLMALNKRGVSMARNEGIQASLGKYIAFLDGDDEWMPGKLDAQIAVMEQKPNVGLTASGTEFIDENGRKLFTRIRSFEGRLHRKLVRGNFIVTSSALIRRDILPRLGRWFSTDLRHGEDWDLWLRICLLSDAVLSPQILTRYVVQAPLKNSELDICKLYQTIIDIVDAHPADFGTRMKKRVESDREFALGVRLMEGKCYLKVCARFIKGIRVDILNVVGLARATRLLWSRL